jgi:hypothetical protein
MGDEEKDEGRGMLPSCSSSPFFPLRPPAAAPLSAAPPLREQHGVDDKLAVVDPAEIESGARY